MKLFNENATYCLGIVCNKITFGALADNAAIHHLATPSDTIQSTSVVTLEALCFCLLSTKIWLPVFITTGKAIRCEY